MKPFAHFFVEILMVLDSPGGCCEAICNLFFHEILIVLDSPGGCCEAVCTFCLFKYLWFWILQEAVMKPFAHFLFKYLWFWILQDAVVKPFVYFFCLTIDGFGFSRRLL